MPRGRPKKSTEPIRTRKTVYEAKEPETTRFWDVFKLNESYTSLLLGIVVVIVAAVLFVSLFRNQNVFQPNLRQDIATQHIGPTISQTSPSVAPTSELRATAAPTHTPQKTNELHQATARPTQAASVHSPQNVSPKDHMYVVKPGDDLWHIAVSVYQDGYKWTKIASANNLTNPNTIHAGDVLSIPQVQSSTNPAPSSSGTVTQAPQHVSIYVVVHGDTLWDISQKLYGDAYQWTKIAVANNLTNPSIIHSGNILKIP